MGKISLVLDQCYSFFDSADSSMAAWYVTLYKMKYILTPSKHTAAALRVMIPEPLKHLAGFASLNIEWLAPHDTITSTIQTTNGIHGTFAMTFAVPAQSLATTSFKITGSKGQISTSNEDGKLKVTVTSSEGHIESTLYEIDGVPVELASFFKVVKGGADDGLGDPYNALKDVALIQAALTSNGERVDLEELARKL